MAEMIRITESEIVKAEALFCAENEFDVCSAPDDEAELAGCIRKDGCRAIILGTNRYTGELYEALGENGGPGGAIIARFGVGTDGVDKTLAKKHRILVTNTPGVLDQSVAEHTIALLGALARNLSRLDAEFRAGQFAPATGIELAGKRLAVIGFGAIGRKVARIASAGFGMKILAADSLPGELLEKHLNKAPDNIKTEFGLQCYTSDVSGVLKEADLVSIHLPATSETQGFFNKRRFDEMKPSSLLINTSRGALINEADLYDALISGRLAGAALDVFKAEPYRPVSPEKDLRTLDNVLLTPHVASNTRECNARMAEMCLTNIHHFFAGRLDKLTRV